MGTTIAFEEYHFDLKDLYDRMWSLGIDDLGDDTRLYRPHPGNREALKWLIEDLTGATADPRRTTRANNALRQMAHCKLAETGWAIRINQVSFRLVKLPDELNAIDSEVDVLSIDETPNSARDYDDLGTLDDPNDEASVGVPIVDVAAADVVTATGILDIAHLDWSAWQPLDTAAAQATQSPGVYAARSDGQIVYVGMAGERRGRGVRGRLQVYARGRGAVSGLGEAALDHALADPAWLAERLTMLLRDGPSRTKDWAVAALHRAELELCWAQAPDAPTARQWEQNALRELEEVALWNRARPTR